MADADHACDMCVRGVVTTAGQGTDSGKRTQSKSFVTVDSNQPQRTWDAIRTLTGAMEIGVYF
jgi:hypothetical protein